LQACGGFVNEITISSGECWCAPQKDVSLTARSDEKQMTTNGGTDVDFETLPPEARHEARCKLAGILAGSIASKEKALAQVAARLDEVAAAIPPARAKAAAADDAARAAKQGFAALEWERDRLAERQVDDVWDLTRERRELADFCKRYGIEQEQT
jgi:hypothetical protein